MVYLTRRERFSAAHRLFNPALSDEENEKVYGPCANPNWHGHNYVLWVTIAGEVDRIYTNVQPELVINDAALGRRIHIASTGSRTAVVWNPWAEICTNMADLANDAYQQFICVETANAAEDVIEIQPGSEHRLLASYAVQRG